MNPILTRDPDTQKDQENGRKENDMISKTQRSAISNDERERAEGMRRKLGQGPKIWKKCTLQPVINE